MKNKTIAGLGITMAAAILLSGCSALPDPSASIDQAEQAISLLPQDGSSTLREEAAVRAEPTNDSKAVEKLPAGARVRILYQNSDGWAQLDLGRTTGWIKASILDAGSHGSVAKIPTIYKTVSSANIRSKASASSKKLGVYKKNTQITAIETKSGWVKITYKGKTGWLATSTLNKLPRTKYTVKTSSSMMSKAGSGKKVSSLKAGQTLTHTGKTSGKYLQVHNGSKLGWVKASAVAKTLTVKYRLKGYTTAHKSIGGKTYTHLYKNQVVGASSATVKKSKGKSWTKILANGTELWVSTSKVSKTAKSTAVGTPTKVVAKYKAKKSATFRSTPNGYSAGSYKVNTVVGSPTKEVVKAGGKSWLHVINGGKQQWVEASNFAGTSINAKLGAPSAPKATPKPVPKPTPTATPKPAVPPTDLGSLTRTSWTDAEYVAAIKKNISKWCPTTPVNLAAKANTYYATSHPQAIFISRKDNPNPNWGNILSVSLHECAHILQFKAYEGRLEHLDRDMDPLWPAKKNGVEHLADCISDLMGGKREGMLPNGWSYWAGYGETCNTTQTKAAQTILNGKALT